MNKHEHTSGSFDLNRVVNPQVRQNQDEYARQFAVGMPFRYVVIEDFFEPGFCAEIVRQFPSFDEKGAINENGEIGGKSTQERVRSLGSAFCRLDDVVQSPVFLDLIGHITGIRDLQYDPYYFGGGTHENRQGQDLDPHVDFNYHPVTRQHRRLNLIVYLNEDWRDEWGGSLQLHRDPYLDPSEDDIITLTPLLNRCVIFETNEYSWHGFERIELPAGKEHLSRKSFALYFYTDSRPADEAAEEHSTVYVERHLPRRFKAGLTLDEADVQQLRTILRRRDQHLKRLYRYIHILYGDVNRLKEQISPVDDVGAVESSVPDAADSKRIIQSLRRRVHELEHSTSWRVTAPLRAVKRLLTGRD